MFYFKNRLIIGLVSKIITTLFKAVYTIVSLFNLQIALLVAVVGLILFITGVLNSNHVISTIVGVLFILSIIYALITTTRKLLGFGNKVKKGKGVQTVANSSEKNPPTSEPIQTEKQTKEIKEENPPRYFKVKNAPNFIMAEFDDRYELYKITDKGLVRQRVDYK